ncbi:MAG: peptidylprolyl isomerase [Dokdonia sp.]|jgi:peptidyl-prolyl cis-trans isomerase SurA|nr:peptidylprolyl isomerase [Cytophagaceae bacterium]
MKNYAPLLLLSIFVFFTTTTLAQKDTDVLLTINDEDITVDTFKRVYLKNLNLVQDERQKDVRAYLDLFIDYKLKIQEAYRQGLDQKESYQKELKGYRKQLSKNHVTDIAVTDALIKEAYDRTIKEVNARHILVRIPSDASPADTLAAFQKITEAKQKIEAGQDFASVARSYSEDPSAQQNGGELGWFKAFKMVYPFETAAYNTTVGAVSEPFKTRFGYHILQPIASRKGEGEVIAAHIMVALKQSDKNLDPEKRIQEIYTLLEQGEDFKTLARTYSDDKKSGRNGGQLNKFSKGQLSSQVFENKVFDLQKEGSYTQPFKTAFGWHIAKLIKRYPVGDFEQMKYELEGKVKRDGRAKIINDSLAFQLMDRYQIKRMPEVIAFFKNNNGLEMGQTSWTPDTTTTAMTAKAFHIKNTPFYYKDIALYIARGQQALASYGTVSDFISAKVTDYFKKEVINYHLEHLEEEDRDFAAVVTEYKEGLLLFDLMESTIWNQAKTDTLGLKRYFQANQSKYQWPDRYNLTVYTASDKSKAEQVRALLLKGKNANEVKQDINTDETVHVLATSKQLAVSDLNLPENARLALGISQVMASDGYSVYQVHEMIPAGPKTLDEARGLVATDYQKALETKWIAALRDKASITIKKRVLKKLTAQLE